MSKRIYKRTFLTGEELRHYRMTRAIELVTGGLICVGLVVVILASFLHCIN